jgi:hypothetical protein
MATTTILYELDLTKAATFMSLASAPGFYAKSPNYGVDAEDPNYKEVVQADIVQITTLNGRRVVDIVEAYGDPRPYADSGLFLQGLGTKSGNFAFPGDWIYVPEGYAYMDCVLKAAAWDEDGGTNYYNVFSLNDGNTAHDIWLSVEMDMEIETLFVQYIEAGEDPTDTYIPFAFPRSTWVDRRVRFLLEFKQSEVGDGYVRLKIRDLDTGVQQVAFDVQNISPLINNGGGYVLSCFAPGFFGMFGACERFVIGRAGSAALPDPVIETSTPAVCCDPAQVNHHTTPGAIEPTVDPTWSRSCDGLGTVPEAPDLVDPESWVS